LSLGPSARWVAEYYEIERATQGNDGHLEVTLPAKDLQGVAKLILRLGGEATVIEPSELAGMVADTARRTLALYRRERPKGPPARARGRGPKGARD
jgi:proteasome accessory factor C